jgi:rSAM/selenodomain-associated transferase 1
MRYPLEPVMNKACQRLLLVIVAKAPRPGDVKTRLYPALTPLEATDLYRCFIVDRIKEISMLKGNDLAISYTPAESKEYFARFTSNGFHLFAQRGNNLGERLNNIFVEKAAEGYDAISIIDSDTPDLPRSCVQQSFKLLLSDRVDAVFGPCHDGGYYLVGMRKPHPELFQDIPWSTDSVLQITLEKAEKKRIKTKLLQQWNDLDTFEDLLEYYQKYKYKMPEKDWAGKETFTFLSNLEKISQRFKAKE